ncbi:hypothetical protein [Mesorhizobium huakuii]|uniref:Uncharacterized protein n=1 Tax=Mesorhizobium huakuii TaxID=28104 RepID=A0ABZ0VIB6_9HYPH|nr:hypothetical protein [Mesorhizobium huakuii]WQB96205.1 hypothetical protein U0R22_000257 [Mesorhizobium huakuii]
MDNSNTIADPNSADLAGLLDRLPHVGRLLEHQLWDAARALSLDRSSRQGRRFAGLVEAGATLDAVFLLVASSKPERSVSAISKIGERWFCSIQITLPRTTAGADIAEADHIDLAAALLSALLSSHLMKTVRPRIHPGDTDCHDSRTSPNAPDRSDDRAGNAVHRRRGRPEAADRAVALADRTRDQRAGPMRHHR